MKKIVNLVLISLFAISVVGCCCRHGQHHKHHDHGVSKMHHEHGDK